MFSTLADALDLNLDAMVAIDGQAMPQPYRDLLVHEGDMTLRLQDHYQTEIHLRALSVVREQERLLRKVLLTRPDGLLVEFGVIRIFLDVFTDEVRPWVESCRYPLGGLLARFNVPRRSELQGFFRIRSDAALEDVLGLERTTDLYGRLNRLVTTDHQTIAEVVEILPPS
ncbi:hypothetical protein APED_27580 [Acanthopleuribacter pedis]